VRQKGTAAAGRTDENSTQERAQPDINKANYNSVTMKPAFSVTYKLAVSSSAYVYPLTLPFSSLKRVMRLPRMSTPSGFLESAGSADDSAAGAGRQATRCCALANDQDRGREN
jgi:hypothetical protein